MSRLSFADHNVAAVTLRAVPGQWVLVNVYRTSVSADAVARSIRTGRIKSYEPAGSYDAYAAMCGEGSAVWVRYVLGLDVEPIPKTITVRMPDHRVPGLCEGAVRAVEISAFCPRCGGPRGPVRTEHFVRDGVRLVRHRWDNQCGHVDSDHAVLREAQRRTDRAHPPGPKGSQLHGVKGGEFAQAVDWIAEELKSRPYLRAVTAADLLHQQGQVEAAEAVRAFAANGGAGDKTSARSAALYLIDRDQRARTAGQWVDGRIAYDFPGREATTQEGDAQ
ncbi:hypothetical protein [Streptomyces sp. NPDC059063]|uniref:hypothetical protein n=1 Tax=Streptomyces sp. NPDC059063 TaxID=3346712 RepID=UPI00367CB259